MRTDVKDLNTLHERVRNENQPKDDLQKSKIQPCLLVMLSARTMICTGVGDKEALDI